MNPYLITEHEAKDLIEKKRLELSEYLKACNTSPSTFLKVSREYPELLAKCTAAKENLDPSCGKAEFTRRVNYWGELSTQLIRCVSLNALGVKVSEPEKNREPDCSNSL